MSARKNLNDFNLESDLKTVADFFKIFTVMLLLVLISFLIILAYLINLLRIRKVKVQKDKLAQLVAQRTAELEATNNELKDFAYIVSHDLKAPLRGISQLANWLLQDYEEKFDDEGREQIKLIVNRIKRMDNLINGILQYSRAGVSKERAEVIDINQVVAEVLEMIPVTDHIKIKIEKKLPLIYGGYTRVVQVFQNLIGNAVKYMDKEKGEIRIGFSSQGEYYKFWIADNGPGIEKRYHEKIFQIFQTLIPRDVQESTGVGLTVVKRIVELYGGRIWLQSKPGEGSCFYFTLPKGETDPR